MGCRARDRAAGTTSTGLPVNLDAVVAAAQLAEQARPRGCRYPDPMSSTRCSGRRPAARRAPVLYRGARRRRTPARLRGPVVVDAQVRRRQQRVGAVDAVDRRPGAIEAALHRPSTRLHHCRVALRDRPRFHRARTVLRGLAPARFLHIRLASGLSTRFCIFRCSPQDRSDRGILFRKSAESSFARAVTPRGHRLADKAQPVARRLPGSEAAHSR